MKSLSIYTYILFTVGLVFLTSCTRRSLWEGPHNDHEEGMLKISLEWKGNTKPQSMGFYFYDRRGGEPVYREGTLEGYQGYLPAGAYDVVICNRDVSGANIKDKQGYLADYVEANKHDEDHTCVKHVDNIYGTGISQMEVVAGEVVEKTATPENLVKKLTFILRTETRKKVENMQLNLSGAVLRKRIVDLHLSDETFNIKSEATYSEGLNAFNSRLSTLGFKGSCPLHVDVIYDDKEKVTSLPLDLTPVLIVFPELEKTLEYTLYLPNGETIEMTVKVHQWESGGGGEIIVE